MLARKPELGSKIGHEREGSCVSMVCSGQFFENPKHRDPEHSVQRIAYSLNHRLHGKGIEEQRHVEHVQNLFFVACFSSFYWVFCPNGFSESRAQNSSENEEKVNE